MKKTLLKYGKHLLCFAVLGLVLALPMVVGAADFKGNLTTVMGNTGLQGEGNSLYIMIGLIINVILGILGIILVLLIIYAGWLWMTSQGDKAKIDKAKDMIKNAVIGLLIVFASYAITAFVIDNLVVVSGASGT